MENIIDEKTESTSSVDSTNAEQNGAASATAQPSQADQSKGLHDAIARGIASVEPKESNPKEQTATEKEVVEKVEGTEEKSTESEQKTEGAEPTELEQKPEDKGPVPYDRFQQVIAEKNEASEWRKQAEPYVHAYQSIANTLQQGNVSPEEFNFWMDIAVLAKSDPIKAMEKLNPQIQQLQSSTGDVLTPELQAAVESGEITLDWAKKMAKAQGQSKVVEKQASVSKEQLAAQQQRQYEQQIHNALTNWLTSKQGSDPDLKEAGVGMPNGKLELWRNELMVMWQSGQIKDATPQGMIQAAELALKSVNATLGRFKPKANGQTHVRSSQSNRGANTPQIKTLADAVKAGVEAASPRR
jgi:hypothetical protein